MQSDETKGVTRETIRTMAAANGLALPEKRVDRVWKQYQAFMQLIARLDAYELPMDAEPSTTFTLVEEVPEPSAARSSSRPSARTRAKGGKSAK